MIAAISYPPIPVFELGPLNLSRHGPFAGIDLARLDAARNGTVADAAMGPFTGSQRGALAAGMFGIALFSWFRNRADVVSAERDMEFGATLPQQAEMVAS